MLTNTAYLCFARRVGIAALVLAHGLVLGLVAKPATAQDTALKQYEVELLIFRVTNPTGSAEDWAMEELRAKAVPSADDSEETTTPSSSAVAPVTTTITSESSIQLLESAHYKLTAIEAALKRGRSYQLLAHIGWTQPGFARGNPRPLAIENLMPTGTGLSGSVSLTRGARLLHLQLELTLQGADGQHYVLREQRALRSTDKHYFDHPHFGVIAVVTPKGQ